MSAQEDDESPGVPEWMVTFGDMMSLLLTFFIMIFSLSEIKEEEKFQVIVESLRRNFGHDSSKKTNPGKMKPKNSRVKRVASMGRAKRLDLMRGGNKVQAPVGSDSKVQIVDYGKRTVTGFNIDFLPGSAQLKEDERKTIDDQVKMFIGKPQLIEIRGHTSRKPLTSGLKTTDKWQLAFQRCNAAKSYLVEEKGIDPERIRIALAGPNEPMFDTAEEIDRNDRVSIFLLDQTINPGVDR